MDTKIAIDALSALAQPHRLNAFRALIAAGESGLTPSDLAERLALLPNTLSFHLKALAHADLVVVERQGRSLLYRANYAHMNALLGFLTENCCQGEACALSEVERCDC